MARGAALSGSRPLDLPGFVPTSRPRPVAVVQPGTSLPPAPYAAAERSIDGPTQVALGSGADRFRATYDGRVVALESTVAGRTGRTGRTERHVSRRHGRASSPTRLAISLTGPFVTAWVHEPEAADGWTARAAVDLAALDGAPDVHDPAWLGDLTADGDEVGAFGQLGLRDVRLVTHPDTTPYVDRDGSLRLTATSAGPAGFHTGHTSVWAFDPDRDDLALEHRADLFVRRGGRVLGDHATHLLRDDERWVVATSTWGDFDRRAPRLGCVVATTTDDLTRGAHVLDARPLRVPTGGLASLGTWDPHLVRDDDGTWLVAFVSATGWFRFHPALAAGPDLDRLRLRAADRSRTATEGVTLHRHDGRWWVLASDGRDGSRAHPPGYPVLDLDLHEHGRIDAAYPTNIPWPTVVARAGHAPVLIGFNGAPAGGDLLGYGTHGRLVVQRPQG